MRTYFHICEQTFTNEGSRGGKQKLGECISVQGNGVASESSCNSLFLFSLTNIWSAELYRFQPASEGLCLSLQGQLSGRNV